MRWAAPMHWSRAIFEERLGRMVDLGVLEVYVIDLVAGTVHRVSFDVTSALVEVDALGVASKGLGVTFGRTGAGLVACCPAGARVAWRRSV